MLLCESGFRRRSRVVGSRRAQPCDQEIAEFHSAPTGHQDFTVKVTINVETNKLGLVVRED
jgi:hypothetical protein